MPVLNILKKIKLPSFNDEFIVDPVDQVGPEHGRQMRVLAAMHREKVLADKTVQARQLELEEYERANQQGDRMDHPAIVHDINVLSVVASESYKGFVANLQQEISASLSARPSMCQGDILCQRC